MACTTDYIQELCDILSPLGEVRSRKMMGDYVIYVNEKCVITACDNIAFVKKLPCIAEMMSDAETGTPYPGAKEAYILDTSNHTKALEVIATLWEKLPFPKKENNATMQKLAKQFLTLTLFALLIPSTLSAQIEWSDSLMWYRSANKSKATTDYDVFYVLPTCVFAWEDGQGIKHYNADPMNPAHRKAWQLSAELADTIFATEARLYLPYYRQATFGTPNETAYRAAADTARADVINAFKHYMAHNNAGRPFVLAGFSQGARMVTELLKAMDDDTYSKMIAAYVVGYGITAADTMPHPGLYMPGNHRLQHIRMATDAASRGVTVCFNSVAKIEAVNKELCGMNIACINPVSWTTESRPATLLAAGASPKKDDTRFPYGTAVVARSKDVPVTVCVNKELKVLVVDGLDTPRYTLPSLKDMFPEGNLHLQELFFYAEHLRENVKLRSRSK